MRLYALLEEYAKTNLPDMEITGLTDDSRKVKPGMLFACIRGEHFDGHNAAGKALESGAAAVLADHDLGLGDRQILTDDTRKLYGQLCAAWFGHPERKMHFVGVTGTNGKTTTTALTGAIMKTFFNEVFVVGNIGIPYTDVALDTTEKSVTVAEVSSFQLETIMDFHPNVSAILNITPDHLNRHGTMENYIEVKERVAVNQTEDDCIVLNYDDKVLREFGEKKDLKPKVIFFSSTQTLKEGMYLDGDMMIYAHDGKKEEVLNVKTDMQLLGKHNHENVMAAVAMSIRMGVPMDLIRKAVKEFKAVEHRIEFVLERSGVRYYNDSKGTNPDAAIQAIRAMPGPTVLIAGGYDKHSEYDEWIEAFGDKVKYLVLIGQTRDKIAECARSHGFTDIMYAEDMPEAVRVCAAYANAGDNVLLSPACASWGMFDNYEQRGEKFKEYARNLKE